MVNTTKNFWSYHALKTVLKRENQETTETTVDFIGNILLIELRKSRKFPHRRVQTQVKMSLMKK